MEHTAAPAGALLRLRQVLNLTGLGKSSIYARISAGTFPRPISLGPRSVAWVEDEVRAWIAQQVQASRQPVAAA